MGRHLLLKTLLNLSYLINTNPSIKVNAAFTTPKKKLDLNKPFKSRSQIRKLDLNKPFKSRSQKLVTLLDSINLSREAKS